MSILFFSGINQIKLIFFREVTGYLLIYRVHNMKSIAKLFPNLVIIRGRGTLVGTNFSLVLYHLDALEEVSEFLK